MSSPTPRSPGVDDLLRWCMDWIEMSDLDDGDEGPLLDVATRVLRHDDEEEIRSDVGDTHVDAALEVMKAAVIESKHPGFYTPAFDPSGWLAAQDAKTRSVLWTASEVRDRLDFYDSHRRHEPFMTWRCAGLLPAHVLHDVVLDVWAMVLTGLIDADTWVTMFRGSGFISDPVGLDQPTEPVTVWRGAKLHGWRRLAWSLDERTAAWFAWRISQIGGGDEGHLFTATVAPEHVLARTDARNEAEVIVDPAGLELGRNVTQVRVLGPGEPSPRRAW